MIHKKDGSPAEHISVGLRGDESPFLGVYRYGRLQVLAAKAKLVPTFWKQYRVSKLSVLSNEYINRARIFLVVLPHVVRQNDAGSILTRARRRGEIE